MGFVLYMCIVLCYMCSAVCVVLVLCCMCSACVVPVPLLVLLLSHFIPLPIVQYMQGLLEADADLAQGFSRLRVVVMDEADRLLDDTFAPQLRTILGVLPGKRQTLLFSATMTQNLLKLQKVWDVWGVERGRMCVREDVGMVVGVLILNRVGHCMCIV